MQSTKCYINYFLLQFNESALCGNSRPALVSFKLKYNQVIMMAKVCFSAVFIRRSSKAKSRKQRHHISSTHGLPEEEHSGRAAVLLNKVHMILVEQFHFISHDFQNHKETA